MSSSRNAYGVSFPQRGVFAQIERLSKKVWLIWTFTFRDVKGPLDPGNEAHRLNQQRFRSETCSGNVSNRKKNERFNPESLLKTVESVTREEFHHSQRSITYWQVLMPLDGRCTLAMQG